jgi:hypothetical protein
MYANGKVWSAIFIRCYFLPKYSALKPNKIPKHRLVWWRNVGSLTFFVCICFVMAPKSRYLKSVNHKIVMWNTNRPKRLYFTIFFNLLILYSPIFSLPFWLNIQSQIFPEKQSVMDNLHILCLFTFHCASWPIFTTQLGNRNCIVFVLKLTNSILKCIVFCIIVDFKNL